ncbi:YoaK family protein [Pseudomonas sp. Marseille-Q8238]
MLPTLHHAPHSPRRQRIRVLRGRIGLGLVAGLSVLAGMTDAIGFMATGDFVSFMSGNTTRLAIAISEGDLTLVLRLTVVVMAFIVGNAAGVILGRLGGRRALPLMLAVATLLCIGAALPLASTFATLILAVIAMGMLNAVVEQVNGLPVGLTYVTGALSRFGRGLGRWILGERKDGWRVQLIPWAGMLVGAILGALLEIHLGIRALLVSALLAAILGVIALSIPPRWQMGYRLR